MVLNIDQHKPSNEIADRRIFKLHKTRNMKPPLRALFLGAPGAGKGTQVKTILAAFPGLHPISSGDSLRAQIASNSLLGSQARAFVDAGALVPDTLVTALILAQLESITTSSSPSSSIAFTKPAHSLKPSESASTPSTSKSLKPSHSDSRNWLLDGFPRTLPQAKTLDEFLEKARAPLTVVINLNVPESVIYERIEGRWIHPASVCIVTDVWISGIS